MNALFDKVFYNGNTQSEINATGIKDKSEHNPASVEKTSLIEEQVKCQREAIKNDRAYDAVLEKKQSQLSSKAFKMEVKKNFLKSESANLQKEIEDLGAILIEILSERDQIALDLDKANDESKLLEEEILAMQMEIEEVRYCNDSCSTLVVDQMKMQNQMLLLEKEQEMLEMRKITLENEQLKQTFMALSLDKKQTKTMAFNQKLETDESNRKVHKLSFENDELNTMINNLENKIEKPKTTALHEIHQGFKKLFGQNEITEVIIKKQRKSICESFDRHRKSFESTIDIVKNGEYVDIPKIVHRRLSFTQQLHEARKDPTLNILTNSLN